MSKRRAQVVKCAIVRKRECMDGIMRGTELCCLCSLSVKRVVLEGLIVWRDKESEPLDFSLSSLLNSLDVRSRRGAILTHSSWLPWAHGPFFFAFPLFFIIYKL